MMSSCASLKKKVSHLNSKTHYSIWNLYEVEYCETGVTCCSGDNPTVLHSELIDIFSSYFNNQSTTTTTSLFTTSSTSPQLTTTTGLPSTTTTSSQPCPAKIILGEQSEETELLRYFRDHVLIQTPVGQEIIELYYQWSPAIVKAMEEDGEFKDAAKEMVEGFLGLFGEGVK